MLEALCKPPMRLALALATVAGMPSCHAADSTSPRPSPKAMEITNTLPSPALQQPCSATDLMDALRRLVAEPRLAAYFHLDRPGRSTLEIVDDDDRLALRESVNLADRTILSPANGVRQASGLRLHVSGLLCQASALSLNLRLPDEGLYGHAQLIREAASPWTLADLTLAEH